METSFDVLQRQKQKNYEIRTILTRRLINSKESTFAQQPSHNLVNKKYMQSKPPPSTQQQQSRKLMEFKDTQSKNNKKTYSSSSESDQHQHKCSMPEIKRISQQQASSKATKVEPKEKQQQDLKPKFAKPTFERRGRDYYDKLDEKSIIKPTPTGYFPKFTHIEPDEKRCLISPLKSGKS